MVSAPTWMLLADCHGEGDPDSQPPDADDTGLDWIEDPRP